MWFNFTMRPYILHYNALPNITLSDSQNWALLQIERLKCNNITSVCFFCPLMYNHSKFILCQRHLSKMPLIATKVLTLTPGAHESWENRDSKANLTHFEWQAKHSRPEDATGTTHLYSPGKISLLDARVHPHLTLKVSNSLHFHTHSTSTDHSNYASFIQAKWNYRNKY